MCNKENYKVAAYMKLNFGTNDLSKVEKDVKFFRDGFKRYLKMNVESLKKNKPVPFDEELSHAKTYLKLEKVRFRDELEINYEIGPRNFCLPALSLQPMVENAVKHNSTQENNPLRISISTDGKNITVVNNLIPRLSPVESTGHGLEYIKQSYKERCGMEIYITQTDCEYKVSIPLI